MKSNDQQLERDAEPTGGDRWLAWQFLMEELDEEASIRFEDRLAAEPALQEVFASVVELHTGLISIDPPAIDMEAKHSIEAVSVASPSTTRQYTLIASLVAAVVVCAVGALLLPKLMTPSDTQRGVAAPSTSPETGELQQLVAAWSSDLAQGNADNSLWELESADDDYPEDWASSESDESLDEEIDWRVMALSGLSDANSM